MTSGVTVYPVGKELSDKLGGINLMRELGEPGLSNFTE